MSRGDRRHDRNPKSDKYRNPFQKDHDRVLYCSAHRRLGGVAQIVASDHGAHFHNRLSHSQKVAQLGRRIAERFGKDQPDECQSLGVDVDVVQAACLAHDLGHPPFGHAGEEELDALLRDPEAFLSDVTTGQLKALDVSAALPEGFEGNAQSFRVVTKLSIRMAADDKDGLDLSRASLAALLKYPWFRSDTSPKAHDKFGAYKSEKGDFDFAKELTRGADVKTAEAEIMDFADDITYAVHDLEDFHRANAIPWHLFMGRGGAVAASQYRSRLVHSAVAKWKGTDPTIAGPRLDRALERLGSFFGADTYSCICQEPFTGRRDQRYALRHVTSCLIERFLPSMTLVGRDPVLGPCVNFRNDLLDEMRILKQVTRQFIHEDVSLGAQQRGHKEIIRALLADFASDIAAHVGSRGVDPLRLVPTRFHWLIGRRVERITGWESTPVLRLAADCVASLNESEAIALYKRMRGHVPGSVVDRIVL